MESVQLKLESYCEHCPYFVPATEHLYTDGKLLFITIYCENAHKCEQIAERLNNLNSNK